MRKAETSKQTDTHCRRFKKSPFPRPASLTAYAADGEWSTRERIDCAATLICGYAATRLAAEGFPPVACPAFDFAQDLNYTVRKRVFESARWDVARAREATLSAVVRRFGEPRGFVPLFSQAGRRPDVTQYAEAVCDALRLTPTAQWLNRPRDDCRFALASLYLAAGKFHATE